MKLQLQLIHNARQTSQEAPFSHLYDKQNLQLVLGRVYSDYHDQRNDHNRQSNESNDHDCAAASRELALYDPMLRLEISVVTKEEDEDAYADERGAQGLAHMSQCRRIPTGILIAVVAVFKRCIQTK